MGGSGGTMKEDSFFNTVHALGGGGGGAASMVSNGPRGGNTINPGTGVQTPIPVEGGDGLTASRAGGGGGAAGAYYWVPDQVENPDYKPDPGNPRRWPGQKGGGVGVEYAGATGAAGKGSKIAGAPIVSGTQTVTAPTVGGKGSTGNYGRGGGTGVMNGGNWYKGANGAVNIKWGSTNTFPWTP